VSQLASWYGEAALTPVEYLEKDWSQDVWVKGAPIGIFPPGSLTAASSCLSQPLGPVHFASTETSAESQGYMNGAVLSGIRAAKEVLVSCGTTGPLQAYYSVDGPSICYSEAVLQPLATRVTPTTDSTRPTWLQRHFSVLAVAAVVVAVTVQRWRRA
jgi:hypothetical protein